MHLDKKGRTADVFHCDVMGDATRVINFNFSLTYLVDGDDVRVIESGGCFCFADESAHSIGISNQSGWEDLECHRAIESGVCSFVYLTHTSRADMFEDLVVGKGDSRRERHMF